MEFVVVWFILKGGIGFIPPQDVYPEHMNCGRAGARVLSLDRPVNPTRVFWPDPLTPEQHCEVDISQRVASLAPGEYHIATTIIAKTRTFDAPTQRYFGHDPHTTNQWARSLAAPGLPGSPLNFRVTGDSK